MTALYWPDLDCTEPSRAIEHSGVVHLHHASEHAACLAWLGVVLDPDRRLGRYVCVRGPGGLVCGVLGDDGDRVVWLAPVTADESVPLDERRAPYAECSGPSDPFCGRCSLSVHGCARRSRQDAS